MPQKTIFGCDKCGYPIEVYPPDDNRIYLNSKDCDEGMANKIERECGGCEAKNIRYFDIHKHP